MSQQQFEKYKTRVGLFGRLLLEAPEVELQEFIDKAPQLFSTEPLALLREFKALVDARLAAVPKKKVIYASNPHDVRVSFWQEIANGLQAEITFKSEGSAQNASVRPVSNRVRPGAQKEPKVAARRMIVCQNTDLPDRQLCDLLDHEKIGVPIHWKDTGIETWASAWTRRRRQIHVIFSKDRRTSS